MRPERRPGRHPAAQQIAEPELTATDSLATSRQDHDGLRAGGSSLGRTDGLPCGTRRNHQRGHKGSDGCELVHVHLPSLAVSGLNYNSTYISTRISADI